MTTVAEIQLFLEEFAPPVLAEDWDNTGLLVGDPSADAGTIITCLTLTQDVADDAVDRGARLVVSHHPMMFRPLQRITTSTAEGSTLLTLIRNGIAVYSPHTSFDSARDGINHQLADSLGLIDIAPIRPVIQSESGDDESVGSGRYGRLPRPIRLAEFIDRAKSALQIESTQYVGDADKEVVTVGVACGAAAEFMSDAKLHGCDVLLTGEARFHACLEARSLNIALVLPGHYATERPAVENLATILGRQFPDAAVMASRQESDPVQWA